MKVNWELVLVGIVGVLVGIAIAPFEQKAARASASQFGGNFQIQAATVDEYTGSGQRTPVHEVFLLNTGTGEVWQFRGAMMGYNQEKGEASQIPAQFSRVAVESSK